jgi:hypothetical protein
VVDQFCSWLVAEGWSVEREVKYVDVLARRNAVTLYGEAKGRTAEVGVDVDTLYGQLLRRMPEERRETDRLAVIVTAEAPTETRSNRNSRFWITR